MQIFRTGNSSDQVSGTNQAVCLAGGGDDDIWAGGWKYLLEQSGQGDVVIIRADGRRGDYESWIYHDQGQHQFPEMNSVTTLLFESASDANNAEAIRTLLNAEVVFFAGGDQSKYLNWFENSKFQQAINYLINVKKISIGGTIAGMAIMGSVDFSARMPSPTDNYSNVTSEDVIQNPTANFVNLNSTFLTAPYLTNVITDTHFSQRDREGRIIGFMARAIYNRYPGINLLNIKAIAVDEDTAICYNKTASAKIYGAGNAFFLKPIHAIERLEKNRSLNWSASGQAIHTFILSAKNPAARF